MPKVYTSDDYCGMEVGNLNFYYGYEYSTLPDGRVVELLGDDDTDYEWTFVAKKEGNIVLTAPKSELSKVQDEEPFWYLIAGIGLYLDLFGVSRED